MPVRRACIALMVLMLALSASATLSRTPRHVRRPPPGPSVTRSQPIHPQAPPAPAQPRQPEAAARAPLDTPIADKWALIIGISKFKDPSLNLKFPAKDARDLYTYLTTEGNFAPDHVKLLLNEDASREKILSALGDKWLPRVANPNDLVLIYISTHGSPSSLDVGGVNYLIAYDTDRESLFSTGIPMQDLVRIIKGRVHSDRIVLVLDACHSGAASPDGKAVFHQGNVNVDEIVQGTGQLVISSSAPDQISWESLHQPNGVFTRHLIEALRQSGPETKLGHAYQYMKDKVQEEVLRDRGALQTPVLRSKWEGSELVLAAPATKPRPGLKEETPAPPPSLPAVSAPPHAPARPKPEPPAKPPAQSPPPSETPRGLSLWQTYIEAARNNRQQGRYAEAEKILGAAQKEADTFPPDDPRRMKTVQELADLYVSQERYSDAEPLYWKVLPCLGRHPGAGSMEMAGVLTNLGRILWKKGKIGDAEAMCKRSLALAAEAHAPDSEDTAACSDVLAQIAFQSGDYSEAEQLAGKALEIREKLPAGDERALANNVRLLAKIQVAQQRYAEAEPNCQRALELSEKVFGRTAVQVLESLDLYAETLARLDKLPESRRLEYRAKTLRSKLGSPVTTR